MSPPSPHLERVRQLLKGNTFLGRFPDTVLDALMGKGQLKHFAKGETIYRRGERGDSLMVVVAGRIKFTNISLSGKEVTLGYVGVGGIYGEVAALDGKERAADAVPMEDTEVFVILTRDLLPTLAAHPDAMLEVIRALCEKIRSGAALIEDSTLEMRARAARGLLRLAREHGQRSPDGKGMRLTMSQEELGKYLGLTRENVNRALAHLKLANVVRISGTEITILDEKELATIGDTPPSKE